MTDQPILRSRELKFQGWNRLEIADIEDSAGIHRREIIDHGDVAVVLPVDRTRQIVLLARQWRAPPIVRDEAPFILEACAGIIDSGETPEQTAIREAWEELGVRLATLNPVVRIWGSPGTLVEVMHLYLAPYTKADHDGPGGGLDHEGEAIECVEMTFDNLFGHIASGEIIDAKTVILAQHLMLERR